MVQALPAPAPIATFHQIAISAFSVLALVDQCVMHPPIPTDVRAFDICQILYQIGTIYLT